MRTLTDAHLAAQRLSPQRPRLSLLVRDRQARFTWIGSHSTAEAQCSMAVVGAMVVVAALSSAGVIRVRRVTDPTGDPGVGWGFYTTDWSTVCSDALAFDHGDIALSNNNGTLRLFYVANDGSEIRCRESADGGVTWSPAPVVVKSITGGSTGLHFKLASAGNNATTVFYGTIWTGRTLLARVMRALRAQEAEDGIRRVFEVPWEAVAAEVPAYGEYARSEIRRLGENHPVIKTQYKLQEIDEAGRMFTDERVALMKDVHVRQRSLFPPIKGGRGGEVFALTVDVAGEDEQLEGDELREANPLRDSTVVTVVRLDLGGVEDPALAAPRYEVVDRHWWTGKKQSTVYAALCDLIDERRAASVVVDATGVGAGLASFLCKRFGSWKDDPPGLVVPFEFGLVSKSDLGWGFLSVVETGR